MIPRRKRSRQRVQPDPSGNQNSVFSYYSNRSTNETNTGRNDSKQKKSLKKRLSKVPVFIALLLIIPVVAYLLTLNSTPQVAPLDSQSSAIGLLRDSATYQKAATEIYRGSLLNRFKITVDSNGFEKQMKQRFPELSQAVITLPLLGRTPTVQLQATAPAILVTSQYGDYVLDTNGKAVLKNTDKNAVQKLQLLTVSDQSNIPIILGRGVLTQQEITFMRTVRAQIQAKNLTIASLVLPAIPEELDVHLQNTPYFIKFDMRSDARESAGAFLAVKQKLDGDGAQPGSYIDTRVEGRAYYK